MDKALLKKTAKTGAAACTEHQMDILKQFCSIDCGSRNIEGNKKVVDIVCDELSAIEGIEIERIFFEGYGENIVAKLTPAVYDGKILISAHTDTVFKEGDTAAHPFRQEGDTAWGLGICDCKAGILVAIEAVKLLQKADMLPKKQIEFIFNCDEEIGSPTGRQVFAREMEGAKAAFVFEPAREAGGILTSRKASCVVEIECTGKSAHTGVAFASGRSAVLELCHRIMRLHENNDNEKGIQFNIGKLEGSRYGNNVVPDHAWASGSFRVKNQADIDEAIAICARVEAEAPYVEGTTATVRVTKTNVPMERTEKNIALYKRMADLGRELGMELAEQSSGGSGDAAVFSSAGIPTADALGGYLNFGIHSYEENLKISSLAEKTEYFAYVLAQADGLVL